MTAIPVSIVHVHVKFTSLTGDMHASSHESVTHYALDLNIRFRCVDLFASSYCVFKIISNNSKVHKKCYTYKCNNYRLWNTSKSIAHGFDDPLHYTIKLCNLLYSKRRNLFATTHGVVNIFCYRSRRQQTNELCNRSVGGATAAQHLHMYRYWDVVSPPTDSLCLTYLLVTRSPTNSAYSDSASGSKTYQLEKSVARHHRPTWCTRNPMILYTKSCRTCSCCGF